jgi:hypothetical protein
MDFITLVQEEFSEIRTVLTGDAGNQRNLEHGKRPVI